LEVADVERLLTASYDVSPVVLEGKFDALDGYEALIVAGPTESFARQDQFVIDQFIMRGGKVLWFLEGTTATMDSIGDPNYMALGQDQTIHQQIFKYGVRLNPDLVMDQLSRMIGLNVAPYGQDPDIRGFLWPYAPMLAPASEHPIVKNSDALVTSFVSTLDTLKREGVEHTLLMHSSPRSRVVKMPHRVSFDLLNMEQDLRQYNAGAKTVAVLSEGVFTSYFTNSSEAAKVSQMPGLTFLSASGPTKMVVCADADVLKNPVNYAAKQYLPLGHDRYTGRTFGNADFLMNMLNYLCEDGQLIDARNKDFKMRMMDPQRIQTEAVIWQFVNVGGPVLILILFGVGQFIIRKRKYAR
jgi:ABC-2 type transport system permease protein